jgi:hypothetical protein
MSGPDLQAIAPDYAFLLDEGFAVESASEDAREFGNAVVVARGQGIRIRFIRERGDLFIDLRTEASPWYSLNDVLECLQLPRGPVSATPRQAFREVIRFLNDPARFEPARGHLDALRKSRTEDLIRRLSQ